MSQDNTSLELEKITSVIIDNLNTTISGDNISEEFKYDHFTILGGGCIIRLKSLKHFELRNFNFDSFEQLNISVIDLTYCPLLEEILIKRCDKTKEVHTNSLKLRSVIFEDCTPKLISPNNFQPKYINSKDLKGN